jgi:hypothetical protein
MENFESSWEGVDEDDYVPLDFAIEELLDEVALETSNNVEIMHGKSFFIHTL